MFYLKKNIETICKGTEQNRNCLKRTLKSGTRSYYQERILSRERNLNQEFVLNHLEIIKSFFWFEGQLILNPHLFSSSRDYHLFNSIISYLFTYRAARFIAGFKPNLISSFPCQSLSTWKFKLNQEILQIHSLVANKC